MRHDLYAVLGVAKDATSDEIRKAYRAIMLQVHPDRNADDPEAIGRFKEATAAYKVLNDPVERRRYDIGFAEIRTVTDLFLRNPAGRKLLDLFLPKAPAESQNGRDRIYAVEADPELLHKGGPFPLSLPPLLNGERLEMTVDVPPGTEPYTTCCFLQNGYPGKNGGTPGDLYIFFLVTKGDQVHE